MNRSGNAWNGMKCMEKHSIPIPILLLIFFFFHDLDLHQFSVMSKYIPGHILLLHLSCSSM